MALLPGARLGPYEIVSPLGAGGMGEVYRARDTRLDRTVAIKILPPHLSATPESRERFQREARIISSLSHPNICALYDVGSQDGIDYAVMEYLEGQTLAQRVEQGPMPLDSLFACAIQIAGALAKAHREGVTHRDLKPGNIMLTKSGAKLLDFGLAKVVAPVSGLTTAATMTAPITAAGSIVGTCQYMSPEQIQGADVDARSDIFAFGAVLYEMATGKKAFDGQTPISILSAILEKEPEPVRALRPVTPPELERLIQTCLAKDPDSRWQSAADLKLQMESIRDIPRHEVAPLRTSRRELAAWALAFLLLLTALGLWLFRPAPTPGPLTASRSSLLPPPGMSFASYNFAVSPDGKRLTFVTIAPDGRNTLWVRSLDSRGAQQINDTDDATHPFWAPDSRRIGFFAAGKLKIVDTANGAIQNLSEAPSGRGGAWNREGTILFAPNNDGPILRVSERGGQPQPATALDPQSGKAHRWPWFLPDEKHFLFFQDWGPASDPRPKGVYAGSLEGGEPKLISADLSGSVVFASGHLLYVQDNSLMAQPFDLQRLSLSGAPVPILDQEIQPDPGWGLINVSVSANGVMVFQSLADATNELIWHTAAGKPLDGIPESASQNPQLSPDGRFLAVSADEARNGKRYIRVHDLQRGVATRLTDGGLEGMPVWSPDGKTIAYQSKQVRTSHIYEIQANGLGKPELLVQGPTMFPNHYSPDGRHLLYMTFEKGQPFLALYDRVERKSSIRGRGGEGQFSPDGKWLAYTVRNIFVEAVSGGGARLPISDRGGNQPRWSRDGKRLFFFAPDRKLMEVSIEIRGGEMRPGRPRVLFQTHVTAPQYASFQYDVTGDGSRFLINSLKPEAPLTLISGWTAALRR
jgi:serine/threonine protein kinase